jgi:hypothetical protein
VTACSVDVLPVHYSQVNSARKASQPVKTGPAAPGYFKRIWQFAQPRGYQFDPTKIELKDGLARLIPVKTATGLRLSTEKERAVLETSAGVPYAALDGFQETVGPGSRGQVRYQLSSDGATWRFHDGKAWVAAGPGGDQANSAAQIAAHIAEFHRQVGPGSLYVRAFLISPTGTEPVELKSFTVTGVAPSLDGWN